MKKVLFILFFIIILVMSAFVVFSIYKYRSQQEFYSVYNNLHALESKIINIAVNLDKKVDDIYKEQTPESMKKAETLITSSQDEITVLLNAVTKSLEDRRCMSCHSSSDPNMNKIKDAVMKIDATTRELQNAVVVFLADKENYASLESAKSTIRDSLFEMSDVLKKMGNHLEIITVQKGSDFMKIELILVFAILGATITLFTIFYKKVFKDIYNLTMTAENIMNSKEPVKIDLDEFQNHDIRNLAETINTTVEKLREKEFMHEQQIEEIKQINDELQASNQQMETLTYELEEVKENLEAAIKEKTQELSNAYRDLQDLDNLKSGFLQSISHEFKTPLTPLFGYLKLFKNKELGELTHLQEQSVDTMLTCAEKLYNTIEDLIMLARIDVEKEQYLLKDVDLTFLIKTSVGRLEKEIAERKLKLTTDIPDMSVVINGDQLMLVQTLLHILRNAIKYTPEKGTISVTLSQEDNRAVVRVTDNGVGIPQSTLADINRYLESSELYMQRKSSMITIGLNLLKHVMIIHSLRVTYKSEKGSGTEVEMIFPVRL